MIFDYYKKNMINNAKKLNNVILKSNIQNNKLNKKKKNMNNIFQTKKK